jgi:hypothetical protein
MIFPQKGWEGWKLVAKFLVLRIEISFQWQLKLVLTLLSEHNKTWRINKRIDEGNPERQSLTTLTSWGWLSSSNWIFDFTHTRSCNWRSSWSNSNLYQLSSDIGSNGSRSVLVDRTCRYHPWERELVQKMFKAQGQFWFACRCQIQGYRQLQ